MSSIQKMTLFDDKNKTSGKSNINSEKYNKML